MPARLCRPRSRRFPVDRQRNFHREKIVAAPAFALAGAVLTFFGFMHGDAVGIGVMPTVAVACGRLWYSNTHPAVIWHWRRRRLASAICAAGFALRESLTSSGWA
jgi:hypothetical protein